MFTDPNVFEDTISRPASAAISDHLFAYLNAGSLAVAAAGGAADGVTVSEVTAAGDEVTIFTEGVVPVKIGASGVTVDHDVMVGSGGTAVDATFGFLAVGRAQETAASGAEAAILLYERPQHKYGSGLGAESTWAIALSGAAIHAGVVGAANPESPAIVITRAILYTTTVATGACKLDVGTTTVSIATASDNLLDGIDVNAATGAFSVTDGDGTNGKGAQVLAAGKWVTIKEISGDATGLAGKLLLFYVIPA